MSDDEKLWLHDLQHGDFLQRLKAASALAAKPMEAHIEALTSTLTDEEDAVSREVARALGKLGAKAESAVPELLTQAARPWKFGCPQRFPECIEALVRIVPDDERLVPWIQDALACSNYGVQKFCLMTLMKIGSEEAVDTFLHPDRFWRASPKSPPFKKLVRKLANELASSSHGQERMAEIEALLKWLEIPTGRRRLKSSK